MGLLIKALLGALVVVLIGVLSKTKNYYIAGLIPLFPTFALMWSIIPYFIYLLSLWYFTGVMRLPFALAGAVVCWSLCAWLLIIGWSRFH
ncbi:MAG: GlpM family protein [Klebsiella michiganensis]|nr:GlpM family protein [Klebsiella michiganensis]